MKRILVLLSAVLLWAGVQGAAAQTRTITGRVTSAETGQPLSGATVLNTGTTRGTQTDAEGRYSLEVPAGASTLTFSALGYGSQDVEITGNVVNARLSQEVVALQGLVVTGLGIERQEAAVGVATQQVSGEELARVEPNIVNTLSGKVAGVNITNSGAQGGSSRIVLRGASSITGNNQPLFVVDGVPIDNYSSGVGSGDRDWGNAAMDINPADIQAITVLKGPNAAALYGSRAANGAIIITTKSGKAAQGGRITASQYVSFEDPLRLPQYQNAFGQGQIGQFAFVDGNGGGIFDDYDESWGPPLDQGLMIPQFNSPIVDGVHQPTPWVSHPDNIDYYFQTGRTSTTTASFATATDRTNVRLSLSRMDQDGMLPGFSMGRTNVGLSGGMDFSERFHGSTSVEYINSDGNNRPGIGYGETNPVLQFIWFGRQVDMRDLEKNYKTVRPDDAPNARMPYSWNYSFHPNPYYLQLVNGNSQSRDRLIGNVQLSYEVAPWLNATVFSGTDWYQQDRKITYAEHNWGIGGIGETGAFSSGNMNFQETNTRFLLSANRSLSGPFSLRADFGGNRRDYKRVTDGVFVAELIEPGIYSVENAKSIPEPNDYISRKRVNSLFGQAELGYNDYAFLTVTGRNDWSSTLPEDNNSYFYPSVSGSFILTDAFPSLQSGALSFGKLRASWARVGNDADPYQLVTTIASSSLFGSLPTYAVANQIANANLKPETTDSWEVGAELGFLNDRLGLDVTYYDATTSDQIFPVQISRASGFSSRVINAGAVSNRGVELLVRGTPIQSDNFRWSTNVTFARNRNKVESLAEGVNGIQLGGLWGANIWARAGEPYGQIVSTGFARDSQGRIIVNSAGLPLAADTLMVIGNYNPDWTGGWANDFSFKGLNLHVLLDTKQGGQIFSATDLWGRYAGVLESTVKGRCALPSYPDESKANLPLCDANTGIIVDGVKVTESGDTVPNDIVTNSYSYNKALYGKNESHIYDASFVKLREVTLTYDVPRSLTGRLGFEGVQLGLIGRNLALWTDNPNIDPETAYDAGNDQGFEFGQLPTARSIGFNVTITP
jgi:TonB-linked SusC/RagA family outer membrane protein